MKKIILASFCLLAAYAPAALAQTAGKTKGPALKFTGGDTHDFGKVKKGPIVHHKFEFTNTGNEPLIINDANPSCGCTDVKFDKQPILPGKKGHIEVGLRTAEQHGIFLKDVSVLSNAKNAGPDKRYVIHFTGEAIEDPNHPSPPAPQHKK
ncbi:MAG: DUF1573 domain-containing protein [Taibaiella sp.]|nr:DUF1573 domain-containing protein [Taibaiella sp.]